MPDFAVILPAAGASSRFGGKRSKLLELLGGRPVVAHSVLAYSRRPDVKRIVVAATAEIMAAIPASPLLMNCPGGSCRAESVLNALRRVPAEIEWVAVHDAARPLVSEQLIDRTLAAAVAHGAAAPALAVAQTIRQANGPLPTAAGGVIPRHRLWAMQTPQIARRTDLLDAFERCPIPLADVTDDLQLLELTGRQVWLVSGEESNLKITTPADLICGEALLKTGA
jgi:2-C-methyl-D-erythritol 4-phosphate cytidylyltransferase